MKKVYLLIQAIGVLYLIIFYSIFIFAIGNEKSTGQWVTCGFITISVITLLAGAIYGQAKEAILTFSALLIYFLYFIVENIFGYFLLIINSNSLTFISLSQFVLFCIFLIFLFGNTIFHRHTQENLNQAAEKIEQRNLILNKLRILYSVNQEALLKQCIDELLSSSLNGNAINEEQVNGIDGKILEIINNLDNATGNLDAHKSLYEQLLKEIKVRKALLNS